MKKIVLIISIIFITSYVFAWYPTANSHLLRTVLTSDLDKALNYKSYKIEGQMFTKKIDNSNIDIGTLYKLGHELEDGKIGAFASYKVNNFISVLVAGDTTSKFNFGSSFCIHGYVPLKKELILIPFVQVSSEKIGGAGIIFDVSVRGVKFEFGGAYQTSSENMPAQLNIILGTSLDPLSSLNVL